MNRIVEMEDIEDANEEDEPNPFEQTTKIMQETKSGDGLEVGKTGQTLPTSRLNYSQSLQVDENPKSAILKQASAKALASQRSLPLGELERSASGGSSLKKKEKRVKILTKSATVELKALKKEKVSKIVAGHLMAVRDKRRATIIQHHLFDHCKY